MHLQRSVNKYGFENFRFEILAICPKEYCVKLEQWFLDTLKPTYNIRKIAGCNLSTTWSKKCEERRLQKALTEMTDIPKKSRGKSWSKLDRRAQEPTFNLR